jgi:hypothetical protein
MLSMSVGASANLVVVRHTELFHNFRSTTNDLHLHLVFALENKGRRNRKSRNKLEEGHDSAVRTWGTSSSNTRTNRTTISVDSSPLNTSDTNLAST